MLCGALYWSFFRFSVTSRRGATEKGKIRRLAERKMNFNSYAWGISISGHLTFKGVSHTFVMYYTCMYYTDYHQNFVGARRNSFLTGRFANFAKKRKKTFGFGHERHRILF